MGSSLGNSGADAEAEAAQLQREGEMETVEEKYVPKPFGRRADQVLGAAFVAREQRQTRAARAQRKAEVRVVQDPAGFFGRYQAQSRRPAPVERDS